MFGLYRYYAAGLILIQRHWSVYRRKKWLLHVSLRNNSTKLCNLMPLLFFFSCLSPLSLSVTNGEIATGRTSHRSYCDRLICTHETMCKLFSLRTNTSENISMKLFKLITFLIKKTSLTFVEIGNFKFDKIKQFYKKNCHIKVYINMS